MNYRRWQDEKDPLRLLLKLHEEVGEVTHAFNRRHEELFFEELIHVAFILNRLSAQVAQSGIPDTLKEVTSVPVD